MKCAGFLLSGANDTASTTATADGESAEQYRDTTVLELAEQSGEDDAAAAVGKSTDEARPPGFSPNSATTESKYAVPSDEAELSGPRWHTNSAADHTAVAQSADEARSPGSAQNRTTTESARSVSSDEAGATAAVAQSVDGARLPGFRAYSATTESDLVPAKRMEEAVAKPSEEVISLPTHTASSPCTEKVCTVERHHQRVDQPRPGDNVACRVIQSHNRIRTHRSHW